MIYQDICADLKRQGLRWAETAPCTRELSKNQTDETVEDAHTDGNDKKMLAVKRPAIYADCAVMRTCRQLHAEFAAVLYSQPISMLGIIGGVNEMPLSPLYSTLIRSILVTHSSHHESMNDHQWRVQLQIGGELNRSFPNATTLRIGWWADRTHDLTATMTQADWKAAVETLETSIQEVNKNKTSRLTVPHNLEIVYIVGLKTHKGRAPRQITEVESIPTPVSEAIAKLRGKPLRRGLRVRSAWKY